MLSKNPNERPTIASIETALLRTSRGLETGGDWLTAFFERIFPIVIYEFVYNINTKIDKEKQKEPKICQPKMKKDFRRLQ